MNVQGESVRFAARKKKSNENKIKVLEKKLHEIETELAKQDFSLF